MIRQDIYVHRYNWDVLVFCECDRNDAPYILGLLDDLGADDESYGRAYRNLYSGLVDTGLTYSDPMKRVSVVVFSKTSSKAQFANSWFHEVGHCAKHIAEANMIDCNAEAVNYIGGELAMKMHPIAAKLMCPTCQH